MTQKRLITALAIALATGGLTACGGGGGGGGTTGTGLVSTSSVGTITGFGSVYVNGVEFETNNASYEVDDESAFDDSALAVGMKVRVKGTVNADGVTGTASSVHYDDDVEGPIDAGSLSVIDATHKAFRIFGLDITVDASRTVFDNGAGFDTLAEGQKMEVSGYFDGTRINATRIERQNDLDNEFEVKGTVASYDGNTVTLTLQNGASAGPFNIGPAAILQIPATPDGLFVEVKLADQGGNLVAIRIQTDDEDLLDGNEDDVSIRGVLADDGNGGFLVNGVPFTTSSGSKFKPGNLGDRLAAGMEVKVEGHMRNGVLVADEIETEDGEIRIEARTIDVRFTDRKNGSVTLDLGNSQSLVVNTDNSTLFEDNSAADSNGDESFNLDELASGSEFLEIKAFRNDAGQLIATSIRREDSSGQKTRLEAPLDRFEAGSSVTLLGITYTVHAGTTYERGNMPANGMDFFNGLSPNSVVKVKDTEPNGTAEELDLES